MVAHKAIGRKARFAAALKEADMSPTEWALEIGKVSRTQLYRVLDDPSNSAPLTAKIDEFIDKHIGKRTTALSA